MDEFKNGQEVIVFLDKEHSLGSGESADHKAKFVAYHLNDRQWADVELETEHAGGTKRLSVPVFALKAVLVLLAVLCSAIPARAQFVGYVSPQTEQLTLANNLACTGGAQTFTTGQVFGGQTFSNLGQTQHYITVQPSAAVISLKAEIDGIDNAGNVFRISDILNTGAIPLVPLALTGSGYYPKIQISVTCGSATGTFTMNYSGASSTSNVNSGSYLLAQVDKTLFAGASTGTTVSILIQPPFSSSSGLLSFFSNLGPPSGSSIGVACFGTTALATQTFPLSTSGGNQYFTPATTVCPLLTVTYTSGGASANTYSLEYIFNGQGSGGSSTSADPCLNPGIAKSSAAINITSATTTQLVAAGVNTAVFVCGGSFTIAPSGTTADTIQFITGGAASCATNQVVKTGTYGNGDLTTTTGVATVTLESNGTVFSSVIGAGVCAVTAGTTVNIQGMLSFVPQ